MTTHYEYLQNAADVKPKEIPSILAAMGFDKVAVGDVQTNERVHFATVYKCGQLALKINSFKRFPMQILYPNKVASDALGKDTRPDSKVVRVLECAFWMFNINFYVGQNTCRQLVCSVGNAEQVPSPLNFWLLRNFY